ncbi:heparinase II/III domain-containing protein [Pleomorphovibrio marinus]|uniref:heparinase II/III domain-containing protein n=1 Tax=Pleomorphovibrio marinus TaxID=2164132 RepID=UPI001E58E0D4|nr:heparinase II/III family protein [Pleomorphovibrio marinus]
MMYLKGIVLVLLFLFSVELNAQVKRDLLGTNFSRKMISTVIEEKGEWQPFPGYLERDAWEALPSDLRRQAIEQGEAFLDFEWPTVKATQYLEFTRTGDRSKDAAVMSQRKKALFSLAMAELLEGKGRFIDDLINGVFALCEQTYWGSSAHFYLYGFDDNISNPTTVVPDLDDPIIDLVVGDVGADLAWIYHFFKDAFDEVSPVIAKRLKHEIYQKVLIPYYERNDFWWITGWDEGRVNNWTPWCSYNMLVTILLMEEDQQRKLDGIHKAMQSVDLFINSYPDDGACSEGPGYWSHAGGKMFDFLEVLDMYSSGEMTIYDQSIVREMGRYIYRAYISEGNYYLNFADSQLKINHNAGRIFRFGKAIEDETMQQFGAFLLAQQAHGGLIRESRIGEALLNLFYLREWEKTPANEPLIGTHYFENLEAFIAREKEGTTDGFYLAAKGGNNNEQHNHNDVGSFMLYYNGNPVFLDVGVGTYTRETFSRDRYSIWTMQSNFHNLPLVNGMGQKAGRQFEAMNTMVSKRGNTYAFETDISRAYPQEANVKKWLRTYKLKKGKGVTISDDFVLDSRDGDTSLHLMTGLECQESKPGSILIKAKDADLELNYNPKQLKFTLEPIPIDDPRLSSNHGEKIYRLAFTYLPTDLSDEIQMEIKPK